MFSIGLFSTYLPYVLLAMFYGLYVGVHSIVKLEQDSDDDADLATNMIIHEDDDSQRVDTGKTFYYDQYIAEHRRDPEPMVHGFPGNKVFFIPHQDPVMRSCYLPLVSRPPPVISL